MTQHTPDKWPVEEIEEILQNYENPIREAASRIADLQNICNTQKEALKSSELIVAREAERIAEEHRKAGHPKALNVTALVLKHIQAVIAKAGKEA